jgi:ankyrin repeat protein
MRSWTEHLFSRWTKRALTGGVLAALLLMPTESTANDQLRMRIVKFTCVKPAAGINLDAVAFFEGFVMGGDMVMSFGAPMLQMMGPKGELGAAVLTGSLDAIEMGTNLAKEIDRNRAPDQLYIKLNGKKVWPSGSRDYIEVRGGESKSVNATANGGRHSIEFWEYDSMSSDDLLGEVSFGAFAEGTVTFQLVSKSEDSNYLVEVKVERPPPPPVYIETVGGESSVQERTQMCTYWDNLGGASDRNGQRVTDVSGDLPPVEIGLTNSSSAAGAKYGDVPVGMQDHVTKAWSSKMDGMRDRAVAKVRGANTPWAYDVMAKGITFGRQQVVIPYTVQVFRDGQNTRPVRWVSNPPTAVSSEYLKLPKRNDLGDVIPIALTELQPWIDCMPQSKRSSIDGTLRRMRTQGLLVDTPEQVAMASRPMTVTERIQLGRGVDDIRRAVEGAGFAPSSRDLNLAIGAGSEDLQVVKYLLEQGARPDRSTVQKAIERGDDGLLKALLDSGAKVDADHLRLAMKSANVGMVNTLFARGGRVVGLTEADLEGAVDAGNYGLANKLAGAGAPANPQLLGKALRTGDANLVASVAQATPPSHEALAVALEAENTDLFRSLTKRGARFTSNRPAERAMVLGKVELARLALQNGGNADEALTFAMRRNDKAGMGMCLEEKAEATPALRWAIGQNDPEFFGELVTKYRADSGTALRAAMDADSEAFAQTAIRVGKANPDAELPRMVAASNQRWVEVLVREGADPTGGVDPALDARNVPMLKTLIGLGARAGDAAYVRGMSEKPDLEMLQVLIEEAGGDPNDGLGAAVDKDHLDVARYLLQRGAEPAGLNVAASRGMMPMTRLLVEAGAPPDDGARLAVQNDHTEVAGYLLDQGASTDGLLPIAAKAGNVDLCGKLVERGANPKEGLAPAVENGRVEAASLLIDAGADVSGPLFLKTAVARADAKMLRMLCDKGADPLHVDSAGDTFLHQAARLEGAADVVSALLKLGVAVDARNRSRDTALLEAVRVGKDNAVVVERLVAAGADVNAIGAGGKIVWQEAKSPKVKKVLKEAGAEKRPPK